MRINNGYFALEYPTGEARLFRVEPPQNRHLTDIQVMSYRDCDVFVRFAFIVCGELKPWEEFLAGKDQVRMKRICWAARQILAAPRRSARTFSARSGSCYICGEWLIDEAQHTGHQAALKSMLEARAAYLAKVHEQTVTQPE